MKQQIDKLDQAREASTWLDTRLELQEKAERKLRANDWMSLFFGIIASFGLAIVDVNFHQITKSKFLTIFGVVAAFLVMVMAFVFIVKRTKKASSKAEAVTTRLQTSFLEALDSSYLNPHHLV